MASVTGEVKMLTIVYDDDDDADDMYIAIGPNETERWTKNSL